MANFFWEFEGVQGFFVATIPPADRNGFAEINRNSTIVASITEIIIPPGSVIGSLDNIPFIGDADVMQVLNISPQDGDDPQHPGGRVRMSISTNWLNGPINIRINFAVL